MAFYYVRRDMPEAQIRTGAAYLARTERLDRIVALDDFDVETAAMLREYLGVPGMGQTRARGFRDKLAMRTRARAAGDTLPGIRPRSQPSGDSGLDTADPSALGPQATVSGRGDWHPQARIARRALANTRRARRRAGGLRPRAVRARRRLSRRLDCLSTVASGLRWPAGTGCRRWRLRTKAGSS